MVLVLVAGCRAESPTSGDAVATFRGGAITRTEVEARLASMTPAGRAAYASRERKRALVDELARTELLALEARRRGLDSHPDVIAAAKRAMVERLLAEVDAAIAVSEQEVEERIRGGGAGVRLLRASFDRAAITDAKSRAERLLARSWRRPTHSTW